MTQIQAQQKLYQSQFKKFSALVGQVDPEYCSVAWGVAHKEGIEAAIAFCDSKLIDSQIMQAYRSGEEKYCGGTIARRRIPSRAI